MDIPRGTVMLGDYNAEVINQSGLPDTSVYGALRDDSGVIRAMEDWVRATRPPVKAWAENQSHGRNGGLFMRDRYVTPTKFFEQMRMAYDAVESDDIVSGVAETTESLAFSEMSFYAEDEDDEDVYNQIAAKIDLDSRMREIWRELFTVSQCYVAVWWSAQTFKVRGTTKDGNARRKSITCVAPEQLTLLDTTRIIPVGSPMFGTEQLAYIATPAQTTAFTLLLQSEERNQDAIVERLIVGQYEPDPVEAKDLSNMGVDPRHLWLLNPKNVFRHSLTRGGHRRVTPVRMKSIFPLLDMKEQLRQMERAHLIGSTNFIILVKKGSDQRPAEPLEIANLQEQVRMVSRVPVMVGDHRLSVEIVTPKTDNTLRAERWNTIDGRITGRLFQMFVLGGYSAGAGNDDSVKLTKVIARGLESRRHMIRRALEVNVFKPLYEDNEQLTTPPKLQFHPRSIALDFDEAYAAFLFDLRQANEISRETILNQFDLDQSLEAEYRKREKENFDEIFQTQVPFSTPNPQLPAGPSGNPNPQQPTRPPSRDNGGGRRNGGGSAPGTGQGKAPRRGAGRPKAADAALTALTITITGADPDWTADDFARALRDAFSVGGNDAED